MSKCTCGEFEACSQCGATEPHTYRDAYEGAREDLLDWKRRALAAEAAIKRISEAISSDSCNGDTWYAAGVNAAVARHIEGIGTILRETGISTAAMTVPTERKSFEKWVISQAVTMYGDMINPEILLAKDDALLDVYYRHDIREKWEGWQGKAETLNACPIGDVGPALSKFRRAKKLTQDEIAPLVGVARSTIANIDRAKFSTSPETLQRYADVLGLEIKVMITEKPKPEIYWCVICRREIMPEVHEDGNLYVHDDIPHPDSMDFAEEEKLQ